MNEMYETVRIGDQEYIYQQGARIPAPVVFDFEGSPLYQALKNLHDFNKSEATWHNDKIIVVLRTDDYWIWGPKFRKLIYDPDALTMTSTIQDFEVHNHCNIFGMTFLFQGKFAKYAPLPQVASLQPQDVLKLTHTFIVGELCKTSS